MSFLSFQMSAEELEKKAAKENFAADLCAAGAVCTCEVPIVSLPLAGLSLVFKYKSFKSRQNAAMIRSDTTGHAEYIEQAVVEAQQAELEKDKTKTRR